MAKRLRYWLLIFFFSTTYLAQAQLTLTNGSTLTVQPNTKLVLQQGATVQSGATLNTEGSLSFKTDLINNGTANFGTASHVTANGTVLQNVKGTGTFLFPHLAINNAKGITLQSAVTITDSLQLVDGILYSSTTAPVYFAPTATNPVEKNNAYILGTAVMNARAIGSNAVDTFLGFSATAGADLGSVNLVRNTGASAVTTSNNSTSIAANWAIHSSIVPVAKNRNISFSWLSVLDNNNDVTAMNLYSIAPAFKKLSTSFVNSSANNPRRYLQNNNDSLNRTFTLFDTSEGAMVKFLTFTGSLKHLGVQLNWVTGTEINNKGYDVERSVDGIHFTKIAFVAATNQLLKNSYDYFDYDARSLGSRAVYYRLKQTYNTGVSQYSNTIVVSLNGTTLYQFNVYPNPFNEYIKVDVDKEDSNPVFISLIDVRGVVVFQQQYSVGKKGQIQLKGIARLAAGPYFIHIWNNEIHDIIKLVKINN